MSETIGVDSGKALIKAADQKHCFSCSTLLHFSAPQCPKCGAQQPNSHAPAQHFASSAQAGTLNNHQAFCRGCGAVIHDSAVACPKCGAQQRASSPTFITGKNRVTAAILAFLLGGIGGHKFYLGQWILGLLYLFFCWTFIPGVIAFIEGIVYLTMSDSDFSKKYT